MRLRSVLYVPANSAEARDAAVRARPDAVIVDLEDSVPADAKHQARAALRSTVDALRPVADTVAVRVNGLDSPFWAEDIDAAAGVDADVLVIPKVTAPGDLDRIRDRWPDAVPTPTLWPMIESAEGVRVAAEIAGDADVSALLIGSSDLAQDLGGASAVAEAVVLVVHAAAAEGVGVIDGIHLGDRAEIDAAFRASAWAGCVGKSLYTGRDVSLANDVFEAAGTAAQRGGS